MRIIMQKTLYSLVLLAIVGISTSIPVFAWLDTIIQRAWDAIRPKETIGKLNNAINLWNIYSQSYELAQQSFTATSTQAISAMTAEFNNKYQCNMNVNEIGVILSSIPEIRNEIQAALSSVTQNISFTEKVSFAGACIRMASCIEWKYDVWTETKLATKTTYLTDDGFNNCKNYATVAYNLQSSVLSSVISLATTTVWNDIYYNGTLDDSPYDLLVDIQRIGDVLFATNEKTDKVLFYTFPKNSIAWFQAIPFDANSTTTNLPDSINLGNTPTNNTAWNNNNTAGNNSNNTTQSTTSSSTSTTTITTNWWNNSTLGSTNSNWQTITNNTTTITPQLSSNNATIQNFACITPTTNTNWSNTTTTTNTTSENTQWANETIDQNNNWQNTTTTTTTTSETTNTTTEPPVFDSNTPYTSPIVTNADDPITSNADWTSPDSYASQEASIKSCVAQCGSLPAVDKAMCAAKCMCGSTSTKDGIFGLQVCTIPAKQNDIVSSKSVQSVEEIISAINGVLTALRNSGEMTKHTKTKEFLDTSLSKIKLSQIFAFDINIAFKPILDSKPRKMTDAETQARNDDQLAWKYTSIDIGAEKNKYLQLYNPVVEEAQKWWTNYEQVAWEYTTAIQAAQAQAQKLNSTISQSLAKTQHAEVADIIKQFLDQNLRFRSYANESLTNIQRTAGAIKQKVQQGK